MNRIASFCRRFRSDLPTSAKAVICSVGLLTLLQSCGSNGSTTSAPGRIIEPGFRAEFYQNGNLLTDNFSQSSANLFDYYYQAEVSIYGQSNSVYIAIDFSSLWGSDSLKPGPLDPAWYYDPWLQLSFPSGYVFTGQLHSCLNQLCWSDLIVGTACGEILAITPTNVVGYLDAMAADSSWELRNCEFNLGFTYR
jgi:hypothetical protein